MTARPLRDYQAEAVRSVTNDWAEGFLRAAILLPTGTGKTRVAAEIVKRKFDGHVSLTALRPGPIAFVAHRVELLDHMADDVRDVAPGLSIGYVQGDRNDTGADVLLCMIQTLATRRRRLALPPVSMVICDEAHHSVAKSYIATFTDLGSFRDVPTLGLSATLTRNDELGLGDMWQKVSFSRDIEWAIRNRWIVPYVRRDVVVPALTLSDVKVLANGEYDDASLGTALVNADAGKHLAAAYLEAAPNGERGVVFCPTVGAALAIAIDFEAAGLSTGVVHGKIPQEERDRIYKAARAGEIQVLINCMVLTEGFDDPGIEIIVIARPTKSQSLFVQMAGRGLRLADGKTRCIIMDTVGIEPTLETRADLRRTPGGITVAGEPQERKEWIKPSPVAVKGYGTGERVYTPRPTPKAARKPPVTARKPLAAATYSAALEGLTVVVRRAIGGQPAEEIARLTVRRVEDAEQMGNLLVQFDKAKRIKENR